MRRLASAVRRPFLSLPINCPGWSGKARILPPDIAVRRESDVGEKAVLREGIDRVRIGLPRGPGGDAEKTRLGIHRIEAPVPSDANPGDIVAEAGRLPAWQWGRHHREIGFAAGAGKRRGEGMVLAH